MHAVGLDISAFGPTLADLLRIDRRPPLGVGQPVEQLREQLASLDERTFTPGPIVNREQASAVIAGLWMHFDFWDEAHQIVQDLSDSAGAYWHGILHRREGDFSNAKYWLRRVGIHPIHGALQVWVQRRLESAPDAGAEVSSLGSRPGWNGAYFVDLISKQASTSAGDVALLIEIQLAEWALLLQHAYRRATNRSSTSASFVV